MKVFNLKYGFWTSYEQTVFMKQEKNQQGNWVLKTSNIIYSTTSSNLKVDSTGNLRDSVSVRECMLYLMCAGGRSLQASRATNNDQGFVVAGKKGQNKPQSKTVSKAARSLSRPSRRLPDDDEPIRPQVDLKKQQDRDRSDRVARRAALAPGSGTPLQPLQESSQDRSLRRPSPPSALQDQTGPGSKPSSRASSTSGTRQTGMEAKGKQRATQISPERPSSSADRSTSQADEAEAARARSTSSQRRRIQPQGQQRSQQGTESEDFYGVSDDENRPPRTLPLRSSRGRPGQPPLQPQQPSVPAVSVQGTQSSGQHAPAPTSAPSQSSAQAHAPQQGEASTRRSTRRRPQQQQQEPRSPVKKLLDRFHKR